MEQAWVGDLIRHWRNDEAGTYRTWFLWDARIKNFRSIRRGLQEVMAEIKADTFGNAYRGSSLETVLDSIAEQRQVFKGADHAFMWKPKLRIPDIYENRPNQVAFGNFLDTCLCCNTEEHVIEAIQKLEAPTFEQIFKNEALRREFENLTRKLDAARIYAEPAAPAPAARNASWSRTGISATCAKTSCCRSSTTARPASMPGVSG